METLFVYLLKSALSLAVLYGFFRLFLNGETFHQWNRLILVSILFICWAIPLIESYTAKQNVIQQTWTEVETSVIVMPEVPVFSLQKEGVVWVVSDLLLAIYLLGVGGRLLFLTFSLLRIRQTLKRGYALDYEGRKVVIGDNSIDSFSFYNTIFMQSDDYANHFESVFAHENAHIRNRHTLDLLLVELMIALQWFNPIIYLLKKRLVELHEYEADQSVVNQGIDAKTYQRLLIQKSIVRSNIILANSLNQSSIKRRITMMLKKKSSFWALLKLVGIIPAAFVCISLFAKPIEETVQTVNEKIDLQNPVKSTAKETNSTSYSQNKLTPPPPPAVPKNSKNTQKSVQAKTDATSEKDEPTFTIVEVMPSFPGGESALTSYLQTHITYPKEAMEKGIQGRVICSFVIRKDGSITDAKIVRSVDASLDTEALRVINSMPKWIPGKQRGEAVNVQYSIPIAFMKQGQKQPQIESPSFPGGEQEMNAFIAKNMNYPKAAKEKGIQGRSIVGFTIESDGSLTDIKTIRGIDGEIDKEAIRIVQLMPKWIPGKSNKGEPTRTMFVLPIIFKIE